MVDLPGYKRALLDWIVANGEPMGTFGTGGRIAAQESRASLLIAGGIDYERSTLGDLGGQEWSEDTYDQAHAHPGLWADVVPIGARGDRGTERWFVNGTDNYALTLDVVLAGVLEAAQVGDLIWKVLVEAEQESQMRVRAEQYAAYLAAEEARRNGPRADRVLP